MRFLAACLLIGCTAALSAQESGPPPALLLEAAHCLATTPGDLLQTAAPGAGTVELGFVVDQKSYPSQTLLTVVSYASPTHTRGTVFRLLADRDGSHRLVRILYSVRFRQSDDGSQQINLVNSPMGGIGTQDEIVAAIRHIGFDTFTVPVATLLQPSISVRCREETPP